MSQNPIFSSVPISNVNNPLGYEFVGKLGYDFYINPLLDIIPYFRLNANKNMAVVYKDANGNYINSTATAELIGAKFSFLVTKNFAPYFDYSAGVQQVKLTGKFQANPTPSNIVYATDNQFISVAEIGFNFKVSNNISLIPYWQYITVANNPDSIALMPYSQGGFNISSLTNTQQLIGFKLSAAW